MQDDGGNVHQNGLAQGDFAGIARLLPEVYRAAAGRWMQQPQAQLQAQPQTQSQAQPQPVVNSAQQNMQTPNAQLNDLGVQPSQGLTAQNPQQPQVQAIPSAEDLTDIRQKLAALDTMMQSNPAYVETRRRGDWQTAAREAEKAGHHDLARVYQMLHEKMTGAPLNVTPYQNPAAKAGDEQGAARPTPAPVHPVDSLHPVDIPKSIGARRDFGRGLLKAMRMRNIPVVDTLKEGLRDGKKDALKHALKRIAQADEEDAILLGETAAQRANDGDEAQAEPREKQGDEVQAKSARNEGKEKTADEGGLELADGYTTESGRPLSEADEKEFIIKPNGSRNFGEITKTISDAVMQQSGEKLEIGEIRLRVGNRSEGLIHAKAHEKQAQDAGYDSIENLIADVAENYDQIYMRAPVEAGQNPTYSLVKLGNKSKGVMNRVAPIYFELQADGGGNYYIVVSAMPKGDKTLAKQTKKDRLIYSNPGLDAATESNAGAVSASARNVGADSRGGSPTSDKSSGLVASTIPSEQEKSKEKSVQAKSAPLTKQEQEALTGTSEEAKEAYRVVRDKLAKSKNKAVVRAAKVGATLFARHADIYAKAYSKATGKPYTALDYLHDKFGLDADGKEADGRVDGLGQRASADVPASQKEAVRKQYAGTASWMKAPNGKATNLTEDQWLTVRTPAFKAWFGDWEQVARLMLPRQAENLDKAASAARSVVGKDLTNSALGIHAILSNTNIAKMVSASATRKSVDAKIHALAVANVDHLFSRATAEYTHKDRDNDRNIKQIHRLFSPFVVGGKVFSAELTVKELAQEKEGNRLYSVEALEIKEASRKWNAAYNATEGVLTSFPQEAFDNIIARFLSDGKNCSKVVDENGEPLVVYHATLSDFTKFRPSESGLYGRGIYLTADKEDTSYTLKDKDWRVMELFANIRNPRDPEAMATREDIEAAKKEALDFFEKHPFDKDGTPASFVVNNLLFWGMQPGKVKKSKLTQVLQDAFARKGVAYQESDKHDGAIIQRDGATWYTADQPNQVKSATGNKGAFSAADEDIYNQRAWVGSAADFDEFDLGYVGTGEGAQVHGYGLYTAQDRDVAEGYKERLSALLNEAEGDPVDYNYVEVIRFNGFRYEKPERWDVWIFERGTDDEVYVDDPAERAVLEKLNDVQDIAKTRTFFEEELEANRKGECGDTAYSEDTLEKAVAMLSPENIQDENLEVSTEAPPEPEAFGGTLFEVEIPENDVLLDEQKPFDKQPKFVQEKLEEFFSGVNRWGLLERLARKDPRYEDVLSDYDQYLNLKAPSDIEIPGREEEAKKLKQRFDEELASLLGSESLERAFLRTFETGKEIYEKIGASFSPDSKVGDRAASLALNEYGIKGITYEGRQDGRCFVVFDDEAIEIINKFNQRMNDVRKGSITPQASGRRVISLFEKADESTFLHEMGHMFLMDLEDVAALDEASAEDLETVRDWAAWQEGQAEEYEDTPWQKEFAEREKAILQAKKSGDAVSVRKLRREWEQERFARGFERYLETGKAPTSVLQRIFQTFKKFLKRIYQAFKGTGGKASPEVEAVMGRMIAEDAERASGESEESPVQAKSAPIQADFSSSKIKGWTGKTTAIVTDSGEEIPVRYRLVEAESLVTSNNAKTFLKNPAYPKSLQPRDRERANMQQQIVEMTSRLRPEDLAESRSANLGAPVVRADGVVLNGNGRAIAITRALLGNTFRDSTGKGYRAFLKEHAKEFGFKPKAVSKMRAPMLVREITAGLTKEQVEAVTTSTTGGSRLGASEQAKQDAEKITLEDLSRYEENERGDLTTAANRGFVAGILYHVSGKNDVNAYTDAKGQVNADGIQRVKRALFQKAYGDDHLLSRMSESTDDDTRNITNGLTIAAPYIARANEKMARGTAHGYKIGETIADAVKRYNHLHDIGQSVEGYLDQQAMFAEHEDSPEMREVLRVLNENRRSGKRIAQFVRRVGEIAEEQGNPNEISLMEGGEPLPLHDVIRSAKEDLQEAPGQQSLNTLFQEAPALKDAALEYGATEKDGEVTFENPGREKEFLRIAEALQGDVAKKLSAGKSVNDESVSIEKGERAVRQVLNSKRDVPNAMYREEIGGIDFLYGKAGDPARKFAGGYGIAHILAKHGQEAVDMIPMVIARGKMSQKYRDRVYFSLDNYMATVRLDFDGQKRTWLVTNFEKYANKKDSPATEDFTRSAANPDGASSTAGGNLSLASTISSKEAEDKGSLKNELQEENFSARRQEALSKVLKEIKIIAPEKLSKKQSGIADFGKAMGMPVVFFKGVTNLHGFHASNGVTFLNTESETSLSWTFWHEALHWMKANNEELFGEIIEDVEKAGAFTKAQLDGYREEIGAPELSDAEAIEEMLADALPDVKRRVPFMKNLGKRNKSLAERFVGWIREVMDRFRDFFHTPARGLTKAQSAAMRDAFAALARDMVDERGRRIFRIDGVGRRITLANGAPLPSAKYSLDNREGRGDNEDKISKAVFDKHLNDGIMKMVEERVRKEIGEHVDFAACCDPVARDAARDGLPYIKDMLTKYNQLKGMKAKPEYLNRQAVKIEYARRCFDNDERIRNEAVRRMVGVQGQGAIHRADVATLPTGGQGESRGNGRRAGLSRSVSGEKSGARAHFEQLYEDMKKRPETGAFSMVKFSRNNRKPGSLGLFRRLLVGLKLGEEAVENLEVHRSNKEKQLVIPASKLNKFMVDKSLTEKNILKTEDVGNGNIRVTYMPRDFHNIHILNSMNSVRQLRKKNPFVKAIYDLGSRAMHLQ